MAGVLFALALLVSAWLLFMLQPMFGKMVLPLLGGAPAVWNTCMVFYQGALLAGYAYAHWGFRLLGLRGQSLVHYLLMLLGWLVLPIGVVGWTMPPSQTRPVVWLLVVLTVSVGLPFFALSATSPMLQAWFAQGGKNSRDPYWLYAASNVGSLGGLLAYPFFVEPTWTLRQQANLWSGGYALLMVLICLCIWWAWRKKACLPHTLPTTPQCEPTHPSGSAHSLRLATAQPQAFLPREGSLDWMDRFWWVALAFAPSSLLLGVTTYMTTDLAAVPLLWVIPLALYLLSFVVVFGWWGARAHRWIGRAQALLAVGVASSYFLVSPGNPAELAVVFALHLGLFFLTALVCHGELVARRPAASHLTEFYLWMALGGVLGGALNALVAPQIFPQVYEYPLMLAVACLLRPPPPEGTRRTMTWAWDFGIPMLLVILYGTLAQQLRQENWLQSFFWEVWPAGWRNQLSPASLATVTFLGLASISTLCLVRRPVRFGLAVFGLLIISMLYAGQTQRPIYARRSFFGVLRVYAQIHHHWQTQQKYLVHQLLHGTTTHGMQGFHPEYQEEAWTYYHPTGPVGMIFQALEITSPGMPRQVAVVGLGTGTLAAYGQPSRQITFFEIDPAVVDIALNPKLFTYLADCQRRGGKVKIVLGDARLQLAKQPKNHFDLLLLDAFSSDSIPLHLLTREALRLYLRCLQPEGLLAVHISNRHLDLRSVLGNLAQDADLTALICDDEDEMAEGKYRSTWVVLGKKTPALETLAETPGWMPLPPDPKKRLWTDDYSNLLDVLNWSWEDLRRLPRMLGLEAILLPKSHQDP